MRAVLRCDASSVIGSGHLARCLTLARALRRVGFAVDVATREPSEHTRSWIMREGCGVLALGPHDDDVAAAGDAALVVVDGYTFPPSLHSSLRRPGRVVCVLDDLATGPVLGDVVLNGNLYAHDLGYDVPPDTVLLCGPELALVRDEFLVARAARELRGERAIASRVLVTMGGADPTGETEKALAALELVETNAPLDVRVVVGASNPRLDAIRSLAEAGTKHHVEVMVDVRAMGELMAWCDVALSAAGGTCLELACVGVASLVVVAAENQRGVGAALAAARLMDVVEGDPAALACALAALLSDGDRRRAMETAQRRHVDGRGKERVASRLAELVDAAVRSVRV